MKEKYAQKWLSWVATAVFCSVLLFTACEISSSDSTTRQVSLNITGAYRNSSGISRQQSGERITQLSVTQQGDQLTAIDNLGGIWTGSVGRVESNLATLTLNGRTTTGAEVVITGTVVIEGTTGTLNGAWIEPTLRSAVSAIAGVAPIPTPTPNATAIPTAQPGATATPIPGATATPIPVPTSTPVGPPPPPGF